MNLKKMSRVAVVTTLVLGVTTIVYSFPRLPREIALWMQPPIDPPESSLGFLSNGPNSNAVHCFQRLKISVLQIHPHQLSWDGKVSIRMIPLLVISRRAGFKFAFEKQPPMDYLRRRFTL